MEKKKCVAQTAKKRKCSRYETCSITHLCNQHQDLAARQIFLIFQNQKLQVKQYNNIFDVITKTRSLTSVRDFISRNLKHKNYANSVDVHGRTPLMVSIVFGEEQIALYLLSFTSDDYILRRETGCSKQSMAIHLAAAEIDRSSGKPMYELVCEIAKRHYNLDVTNAFGHHAMSIAAKSLLPQKHMISRFLSGHWYRAEKWSATIHFGCPYYFKRDALYVMWICRLYNICRDVKGLIFTELMKLYKLDYVNVNKWCSN